MGTRGPLAARPGERRCVWILLCWFTLTIQAFGQGTSEAWIHLSESPVPPDPHEARADVYTGAGPVVYAHLIASRGGEEYVSGAEFRHWLTVYDDAVTVEDFCPAAEWVVDFGDENRFRRWPTLPGEQGPVVLGYWRLTLLAGAESRCQLGLSAERHGQYKEPVILTADGRGAPLQSLAGAGVNMAPPEAYRRSRSEVPAIMLSWDSGPDRTDLQYFPSVATLNLLIPYPGRIRWGTVGFVIRDDAGVVSDTRFQVGRTSGQQGSQNGGWLEESPFGSLPQPGVFGFRAEDTESATELGIRVALRIAGPARPISIRAPWVEFEALEGEKVFVWSDPDRFQADILGGVGSAGFAVHRWSPREVDAGVPFVLELVGDGFDSVTELRLLREGEVQAVAQGSSSAEGRQFRVQFPEGVPDAGEYQLELYPAIALDIQPQARFVVHGTRTSPSGTRQAPAWFDDPSSINADYVILTTEANGQVFYDTAVQFGTSIIEHYRPYRTQTITVEEARDAFPGEPDSAAIKLSLRHAYEHWRVAPLFALIVGQGCEHEPALDRIRAPVFSCGEGPGVLMDGRYPMDSFYGDVIGNGEGVNEIVVGRINASAVTDITYYGSKLFYYDRAHARQGLLFCVGDAQNNAYGGCAFTENDGRRSAAERIIAETEALSGQVATALYSKYYFMLDGNPLPTAAEIIQGRDDIIAAFNAQPAIVEFFGNTCPASDVVHLLGYRRDQGDPLAFRAGMLAYQGTSNPSYPFACFSHCLSGGFDDFCSTTRAPGSDFVLEPRRGAVAAIAKGDHSYFPSDEALTAGIHRALHDDDGGSCAGYRVTKAVHAFLNGPDCAQARDVHNGRSVSYCGDPSLVINLPRAPKRLEASFESWGAVPLQGRLLTGHASWLSDNLEESCSGTRIVHGGPQMGTCGSNFQGQVFPLSGERLFRVTGSHERDGQLKRAAWLLFNDQDTAAEDRVLVDLSGLDPSRSVLSFWVYHEDPDVGFGGHLWSAAAVDLISEDGRILSAPGEGAVDQHCKPYGAAYAEGTFCLNAQWKHRVVRLDRWVTEGVRVDSVIVRYEGHFATSSGQMLVALEDVHLGEWTRGTIDLPGNVVIDGEFSEDLDQDGRPDFWTAGDPKDTLAEPGAQIVGGALALRASVSGAEAISQVLPRCYGACLDVRLRARGSTAPGGILRVMLKDLSDESLSTHQDLPLSPNRLDLRCGVQINNVDHRHCLVLEAIQGTAYVDGVSAVPLMSVGVPEMSGRVGAERVRIRGPRPSRGSVQLEVSNGRASQIEVELFDITGRLLGRRSIELPLGDGLISMDLEDVGAKRLRNGIYFLRIGGGTARQDPQRVLLLR